MKRILLLTLILTGCDQQQPVRTYTDDQGVKHEVVREGGGFGEHLAQAAVAGAVGGAAAGAGHRMADHVINKWQDRKASRGRSRRVYSGSARRR